MYFRCCVALLFLYTPFVNAEEVSVRLGVSFKSGHTSLPLSEQKALEDLANASSSIKKNKAYIFGHTDSLGSDAVNQELSEGRAENIKSILIKKGFEAQNLTSKGMGEAAPQWTNKTKEGRAQNRRVVVTFLNLSPSEAIEFRKRVNKSKLLFVQRSQNKIEKDFIVDQEPTPIKVVPQVEKPRVYEAVKTLESKPDTPSQGRFRYSFVTGGYYNVLLAEDRDDNRVEAEWISKLNVPIGALAQFRVAGIWLGLKAFHHIQDYRLERSPNFVWDEDTPSLFRASLIADYETNFWGFGFDVDYNQESFVYEQGTGNVTLDRENLVGLTLRGKYKYFENKKYSSRVFLQASLPFSGDGDIDSEGELGYQVSLDLRRSNLFKNHDLRLELYYGLRNFTNQQNDQEESVLGLNISIDSKNWL